MRSRIVHEGVKHLEYEIRQIVDFGHRLEAVGVEMTWENIGDPIAMGETVKPWISDIVHELLDDQKAWAYCPSRGVNAAREFLAAEINRRGGAQVTGEDILFVNGIADAVDKVYDLVRRDARILMPSPCYPTHSSNEWKRGDYPLLLYHLDPHNGWQPDLDEIRMQVRYNPQIIGISLVHPDNPTGYVYTRETLSEIVEIAREHKLFLICDEVYAHITFNGAETCHLSEVIGDVPALSLRGISKEFPWPGARCGWIEILNARKDPEFAEYARALINSKMMEVCSTTLPQMSVAKVMGDDRYPAHLRERAGLFEMRANEAYDAFNDVEQVCVNRVQGALYFPVVFKPGVLTAEQSLPIENPKARALIEEAVRDVPVDKRFVYYLMGSAGICVTPLCGFHSSLEGFRMTLLRVDDDVRRDTLRRLTEALQEYLAS